MRRLRVIQGFKDPVRRPRYIIWTGSVVLALGMFVVASLAVTSTNWFCAEVCHHVQADTVISFERSSHSQFSCVACHLPVNMDPVSFLLSKVESLAKIYPAATQQFSFPLNPGSRLALSPKDFPDTQCTQCHDLERRPVTPSPGIIMDHEIHAEEGIICTACHNRVAHRQDFQLTLVDPRTGQPNVPHEDFMTMTACFRCHTLTEESPSGIVATGACEACHTPDFDLMPPSHDAENFYNTYGDSSGHAELARQYMAARESAEATMAAFAERIDDAKMEGVLPLPAVGTVDYCSTCHVESVFCDGCHGMEIPHPEGFSESHAEKAAADRAACERCHATAPGADFCNECHHEGLDPARSWMVQHMDPVRETGARACFDCHDPVFCATCHVPGSIDEF